MFYSGAAAAGANDGLIVGEDIDRRLESDTVITSAMKGVQNAAYWAAEKFYAGEWDSIGDVATTLSAKDGAVCLPTATWCMENYTIEEYEAQLAAIIDGSLVIDNTVLENDAVVNAGLENLTIQYV